MLYPLTLQLNNHNHWSSSSAEILHHRFHFQNRLSRFSFWNLYF
jgi:hypothetical protein